MNVEQYRDSMKNLQNAKLVGIHGDYRGRILRKIRISTRDTNYVFVLQQLTKNHPGWFNLPTDTTIRKMLESNELKKLVYDGIEELVLIASYFRSRFRNVLNVKYLFEEYVNSVRSFYGLHLADPGSEYQLLEATRVMGLSNAMDATLVLKDDTKAMHYTVQRARFIVDLHERLLEVIVEHEQCPILSRATMHTERMMSQVTTMVEKNMGNGWFDSQNTTNEGIEMNDGKVDIGKKSIGSKGGRVIMIEKKEKMEADGYQSDSGSTVAGEEEQCNGEDESRDADREKKCKK